MRFKLLVAFVDDHLTAAVTRAAREAGATGSTVVSNARGEGLQKKTTFLGLSLETQRDMVLLLVEEHRARHILETVGEVGEFYNNYKKLNWPEAHTHNPGSPLKTKSELGDMLYYFVRICHEHNTTLGDVMEGNVRKLKERHARNTNVPKSS